MSRNQWIENRGSKIAQGAPLRPRATAILYLLSSILFLSLPTGCNVLGVLVYKTRGPAPRPAEYIPAKEPMLILTENWRNPASSRLDAERLSRHIASELDSYQIAPTVDFNALDEVRARPNYSAMKLSEIGQAVGAKQVLYVNLIRFSVDEAIGSEMIKGQIELTVKVIDATTGKTLWPSDEPDGKLLSLDTPHMRAGAGIGPSGGGPTATEAALRDTMCKDMAERIVKLFRQWTPDFDNEGKTD